MTPSMVQILEAALDFEMADSILCVAGVRSSTRITLLPSAGFGMFFLCFRIAILMGLEDNLMMTGVGDQYLSSRH